MTTNSLDFAKVEALRKHMLLTVRDISDLFGVTRATYYGWLRGKPIRKTNDATVRAVLKRLLAVMTQHSWPMPEIIAADQKQRKERLQELLDQN